MPIRTYHGAYGLRPPDFRLPSNLSLFFAGHRGTTSYKQGHFKGILTERGAQDACDVGPVCLQLSFAVLGFRVQGFGV